MIKLFLSIIVFVGVFAGLVYMSVSKKQIPVPTSSTSLPVVTATSTPPSPKSVDEIVRGDTSKKQVIFTFDGGAGTQSLDQILATLKKYNITSTFFLTGKMIEDNPEAVKKIVAGGHEIFNHTYSHPHLPQLSDAGIVQELSRTDELLTRITGVSSKPYFRAPYGDRNLHVREVAFDTGYQSVYWTVDALDWKEGSGETAETVRARVLSSVAPGTIYLMHLGDTITGNILDTVFAEIINRGYQIVSLRKGL